MKTSYIIPAVDIIRMSPLTCIAVSKVDEIVSTDTGGGEVGGGTTDPDPWGGDIIDAKPGDLWDDNSDGGGDSLWNE